MQWICNLQGYGNCLGVFVPTSHFHDHERVHLERVYADYCYSWKCVCEQRSFDVIMCNYLNCYQCTTCVKAGQRVLCNTAGTSHAMAMNVIRPMCNPLMHHITIPPNEHHILINITLNCPYQTKSRGYTVLTQGARHYNTLVHTRFHITNTISQITRLFRN